MISKETHKYLTRHIGDKNSKKFMKKCWQKK